MSSHRSDDQYRYRVLLGAVRARVEAECAELLSQISAVDQQLAELAAQRHRLATRARERLHLLRGPAIYSRSRQPAEDGSMRLPPLTADHSPLWGRRLRSAIVTILRRSGTLRLPELHALLHHHGYRIQSEHPVKALSDACSYEVEKGRLTKRARGTYGPAGRHRPRDSFERSPCGPLDHASPTLSPHAAA